jgi:hypothetical protein
MLVPKKNRLAVYSFLFKGTRAASNERTLEPRERRRRGRDSHQAEAILDGSSGRIAA